MATLVTRYVDPNSTTGGDGTTNALTGAARAYVSLSAWEAATQADIVTADQIQKVICSSDDAGSTHLADTTAVLIDGWTTDATRYIQIEAASSHGGKWNASIYRMEPDAGAQSSTEDYVKFIGIQFKSVSTNSVVGSSAAAGITSFDRCIIKGLGAGTPRGIGWDFGGSFRIYNCIVYNCVTGISLGGTSSVYSTTIAGCTTGLQRAAGTLTAKNCYAQGSTAAYSGTITKTTCASSDATGSAGLQNIAANTTNFTNVSAGSEDFHLPAGSALIDVGTDTSGDAAPLNFTTDIDGQTRTGTWDIGADEYVAAGGIIIPVLLSQYRRRWAA